MPTTVTSVTNHFPEAQNGFTTTTASAVSSGATTVSLNSVAGYTNGEPAVFVIDPTDATKKQTFTGTIDTAGNQVTNVVWTAGTNQSHALGATVVDYATATHVNMVSKGLKVAHNQDGTLKNNAVVTAAINNSAVTTAKINDGAVTNAKLDSTLASGWIASGSTVSSNTYNGNRSYTVVTGTDLSSVVSPGMRVRTTRTVSAPTQSASLNGTNHYFSKSSPAGMTFTDDFVVSAWVKLNAYGGFPMIASRYNGTSGWILAINSSGQVYLQGFNGGSGNQSAIQTYQSVPINKWVHIAAQLDMSSFTATTTTSYIMLDGVDVPASVSRSGTNPTALVQAGNLEIGSSNGGANPFNGKLAQVAVFNAKVTQATMRGYISQGLAGNETSLISAYSLSNSVNDLNTSNANNLTAQNSATTTNADSPFGGQAGGSISATLDYGIVQAISGTSITVQVPEGCTIPTSGGVSALAYSIQKSPYGFPANTDKWIIVTKGGAQRVINASNNLYYNSDELALPIGSWNIAANFRDQCVSSNNVNFLYLNRTISTSTNSFSWSNGVAPITAGALIAATNNQIQASSSLNATFGATSETRIYAILKAENASGTLNLYREESVLAATNAYL